MHINIQQIIITFYGTFCNWLLRTVVNVLGMHNGVYEFNSAVTLFVFNFSCLKLRVNPTF